MDNGQKQVAELKIELKNRGAKATKEKLIERCVLLFVLTLSFEDVLCYMGDPVMYLPPFEVRTIKDNRHPMVGHNQQFPSGRSPISSLSPPPQMQQQPIIHTTPAPAQLPHQTTRLDKNKLDAKNFTFMELLDAMNNLEESKDEHREISKDDRHDASRAAYDYPPSPQYGYQAPYGYQQPSPSGYSYGPPGYQESAYVPPRAVHHTASKISLLKPDLSDLVKPVSTKVASKVSGLIGLVLALFTGSAPNDLELKGYKDIVINGIVKPLLLAKGGIKSLISKMTIPMISLLLINLEVLITVWWLWEDCEEPSKPPPPPYSYPKPTYGYNQY